MDLRKRTIAELPKADSNLVNWMDYLQCLICYNGEILLRPYNLHHICFDDEDMDDHFCKIEDVKWWCLVPHYPYEIGGESIELYLKGEK